MLTNDQLRHLLDELPGRETRSGLEPYRELVMEMRRRKYSYREISRLLTERCGFQISHSTIHDFVKRHCPELPGSTGSGKRASDRATPQAQSGQSHSDAEAAPRSASGSPQ